jgi:urease accessory protein
VRDDDGQTVLAQQSFRAPFHLSKPYWDDHALIVQVVNPTAGVLAGDRLESEISVGRQAALLVTTPSANRVFKMRSGMAECRQRFKVAAGGWLEFMPEPLVLHRGSLYHQVTEIDVAEGGSLFFADLLMPGRLARGERWAWESLVLESSLRCAGKLIVRERLKQSGEDLRRLAEFAGASEGACFANVLLVGQPLATESSWREAVRALHGYEVRLGVSELRGGCGAWSLKLVAADNLALRRTLKEVRRILSPLLPKLACDPRKL